MNSHHRHFEWLAIQESDTERLGILLAEALPAGATVSLCGTLGAGKTRLVQALAEACGIDRPAVVSPTFVLCQTHVGRRTIHHLDAYRIRDDDEFLELGVSELFGRDALTIIEWGDRVAACLPEDVVVVRIDVTGETSRCFHIEIPDSSPYDALAERLALGHSWKSG